MTKRVLAAAISILLPAGLTWADTLGISTSSETMAPQSLVTRTFSIPNGSADTCGSYWVENTEWPLTVTFSTSDSSVVSVSPTSAEFQKGDCNTSDRSRDISLVSADPGSATITISVSMRRFQSASNRWIDETETKDFTVTVTESD